MKKEDQIYARYLKDNKHRDPTRLLSKKVYIEGYKEMLRTKNTPEEKARLKNLSNALKDTQRMLK